MAAPIRDTESLIKRIEQLRDDFIKRFMTLITLASVEISDRNTSALVQYQIQLESTALIRAGEDVQTLIRQLQETWLFGQLNPVGNSKAQMQTDENANVVGKLLEALRDFHQTGIREGARLAAAESATNGA